MHHNFSFYLFFIFFVTRSMSSFSGSFLSLLFYYYLEKFVSFLFLDFFSNFFDDKFVQLLYYFLAFDEFWWNLLHCWMMNDKFDDILKSFFNLWRWFVYGNIFDGPAWICFFLPFYEPYKSVSKRVTCNLPCNECFKFSDIFEVQ